MQYLELQRAALALHRAELADGLAVDKALLTEWIRLGWLEPARGTPRRAKISAAGWAQINVHLASQDPAVLAMRPERPHSMSS